MLDRRQRALFRLRLFLLIRRQLPEGNILRDLLARQIASLSCVKVKDCREYRGIASGTSEEKQLVVAEVTIEAILKVRFTLDQIDAKRLECSVAEGFYRPIVEVDFKLAHDENARQLSFPFNRHGVAGAVQQLAIKFDGMVGHVGANSDRSSVASREVEFDCADFWAAGDR